MKKWLRRKKKLNPRWEVRKQERKYVDSKRKREHEEMINRGKF